MRELKKRGMCVPFTLSFGAAACP